MSAAITVAHVDVSVSQLTSSMSCNKTFMSAMQIHDKLAHMLLLPHHIAYDDTKVNDAQHICNASRSTIHASKDVGPCPYY